MTARLTGVVLLVATGCAGSKASERPQPAPAAVAVPLPAPIIEEPAPEPPPPPAAGPVELTVAVEAFTKAGELVPVRSGQTLHSGDRIAFTVGVTAPAYVYVALADAEQTPSIIFPREGDVRVEPGKAHRIPAEGQWFRLDKDTGYEDLFVYAAGNPIARDEILARTRGQLDRLAELRKRAQHKPKPARPRPKQTTVARADDAPGALTDDTRGLELDEGPTTADAGAVIQQHLLIKHAR